MVSELLHGSTARALTECVYEFSAEPPRGIKAKFMLHALRPERRALAARIHLNEITFLRKAANAR